MNENEPVVPLSRLAACAAWGTAVGLVAIGWVVFMIHRAELAQMFGFTGCVASAVAATLSVRCFATRLARLIRHANGMPPARSDRPLRSVGD